jgi:pimeloyl-ACP methyl ester carboxylesterase
MSDLIRVNGRAVEIAVAGAGGPLIVLESGLGDDLSVWADVVAALTSRARTFAYSRPGYGRSAAASAPRDVWTSAEELNELLRAAGEQPPFVLVGHSLGALIVQAFAAAQTESVAAMVLVDPTHPDLIGRLRRDLPADGEAFETLVDRMQGTARLEIDALRTLSTEGFWGVMQPYRGPVIILGAWMDRFNESAAYRRHHRLLIEETHAHYPQAELRRISCGHYIQIEHPVQVVAALRGVLSSLN